MGGGAAMQKQAGCPFLRHHHHHLGPGYTCSGVGRCGGNPTAKREAEGTSPKITYSKETIAKEGDEVKIDCAVEGVDLTGIAGFSVSWSKINEEKPTNSYPIATNDKVLLFSNKFRVDHPADSHQYSLIIKSMTEEDTGLYRCTVNFGEDQKINADVPVTLQKAPYFTDDFTKTLTVTEGDAISIDCQPGGSPKPDVYWERLNQELPYYGGKFFKSNQLDIPLIERSHKGHYVCYADNGIGDPANSHVILEVQFVPEITVAKDRVFASVTEEVVMECKVLAHPPADVAWFKGDSPILGSANMRLKTETLEDGLVVSSLAVNQVSPEDVGTYTCRALNTIGTTEKDIALMTKSPPLILKQSGREVFYDNERSRLRDALPVVLECEADGAPSPKYRWTKDDKAFIWQADPRISMEEGTGNLLISDPTMDDNGLYQCFAYNDLGTAVSNPIYLLNITRIEFANDKDESDTYNVEAELGRPFKLSCPEAYGYPTPSLSWVKAIQHETQIELVFLSDDRIIAGPNGSLWFTHVTQADDTRLNNFQYICLANTSFAPYDYSMASVIELTVKDPADGAHNLQEEALNVESFPMYTSPATVQFIAGRENKLYCIYGGEPVPEVSWRRKDGREINSTHFSIKNSGSTLIFLDTKVDDAGVYECAATNGVGRVKSSAMTVTVVQVPTFVRKMASLTVEEGATIDFHCEVEASDNVTLLWLYNGRPLPLTGGSVRRTVDGSRLTLTDVTTNDMGNYACNATTATASVYDQATLTVMPAGGFSRTRGGASCEGLTELRAEVAQLKDTLQAIYSVVKEQQELAQGTRDILTKVADKLQVPVTRTDGASEGGDNAATTEEGEGEGVEPPLEVEDQTATTLTP
nr:hemicentin-2-like isoform X1 [Procambarus clarkii]